MSDELKTCPQCESPYGYPNGGAMFACPSCSFEWNPTETTDEDQLIVKDANGNQLFDGDTVIVIKTLNVKGASGPIKAGTKVKNIRLADGDHNIDCKIPSFGSMGLKSEFVKKA